MRLIVLDTNVLVSALLSPSGAPARVLDLVLGGSFQICYDSRILAEYSIVLLRPKYNFDKQDVKVLLDYLSATGISVTPAPLKTKMADGDDRMFYEVARHCGAKLVTGNLKHFPDGGVALSPSELLDKMP